MSKRNVLAKFYEKFEHVVFIDIGLVCQDRKGKNVTNSRFSQISCSSAVETQNRLLAHHRRASSLLFWLNGPKTITIFQSETVGVRDSTRHCYACIDWILETVSGFLMTAAFMS